MAPQLQALTRPGRLDRQIVVPIPDLKGRMEREVVRFHFGDPGVCWRYIELVQGNIAMIYIYVYIYTVRYMYYIYNYIHMYISQ